MRAYGTAVAAYLDLRQTLDLFLDRLETVIDSVESNSGSVDQDFIAVRNTFQQELEDFNTEAMDSKDAVRVDTVLELLDNRINRADGLRQSPALRERLLVVLEEALSDTNQLFSFVNRYFDSLTQDLINSGRRA